MYRAKAAVLFFVITSALALIVTALASLTPSLLRIYLEYREVAAFTGNIWLVDKVKAADRYSSAAEWVLPYEANGRALYWEAVTTKLGELCSALTRDGEVVASDQQANLVRLRDAGEATLKHKDTETRRFARGKDNYTENFGFALMIQPGAEDEAPDDSDDFAAFSRAMAKVLSWYEGGDAGQLLKRGAHVSAILTRALGLDTVRYVLAPVLASQLVYVVNRNSGLSAFYPASAVFDQGAYDPRNRPWYLVLRAGEPHYFDLARLSHEKMSEMRGHREEHNSMVRTAVEIGRGLHGLWEQRWTWFSSRHVEYQTTAPVGPVNIAERCVEHWTLVADTSDRRTCRWCGQESTIPRASRAVAGWKLVHQDRGLLEARPVAGSHAPKVRFPAQFRYAAFADRLVALAATSSDDCDELSGDREIPAAMHVPSRIRGLVDIAGDISRGHLPFRDVLDVGTKLYADYNVKATCSTAYLRHLFTTGSLDPIDLGQSVERVLLLDQEDELLDLYHEKTEEMTLVLQRSSREFWYALKSSLPEPYQGQHWDFALLETSGDDPLVLVTDTFLNAWNDDPVDASRPMSAHLTWRRADVHFYRKLYETILGIRKDPLALLAKRRAAAKPK